MKRLIKVMLAVICILSLVITAVACKQTPSSEQSGGNDETAYTNPLQLDTIHAMLKLAGYTESVATLELSFSAAPVAKAASSNNDNNGNGNKKVTVDDAYIDENGDFNIDLSNGNSVNAGELADGYKENNGNHYGQDKQNKETHIGHNGNWWVDGKDTGIPAKGNSGADGVGIASIAKQSTEGLVDTYVITLTNGKTFSFTVTNARSILRTELDSDGYLHIYYNDGTEDNVGKITGEDGVDGVGIKNMYIDENIHLIVVLTDGTIIDCGAIYVDPDENIPNINPDNGEVGEHEHTYGEWTITEFATCEEPGSSARKCTKCDKIEVKILYPTGHQYKNCVCQECGDVREHNFGSWYTLTPAGCESDGIAERKCTECDETETKVLYAYGHNYKNDMCSNCGKVQEHSYGDWTVINSATCTTNGTERRTCSDCGKIENRTIGATGHSYSAWTPIKNATCTTSGTERRSCSNCGRTESRTISATGHSYNGCTCINCGITKTHAWSKWETVSESTCVAEGSMLRQCANCSQIETKAIAKTDHNLVDRVCTNCGLEYIPPFDKLLYRKRIDGCYEVAGIGTYTDGTLIIPSTYNGIEVRSIGVSAFESCQTIRSVEIPETIVEIRDRAFNDCSNLKKVVCQGADILFGNEVFSYSGINDIILPYALKELPPIFYACNSLESIVLPNTITKIPDEAFVGCSSLKEIDIPVGVTYIGWYAFFDSAIEVVRIPATVSFIDEEAFYYCPGLTSIIVDENNEYYTSIDGSLYTKDGKTLIVFGKKKDAVHFTVPEGVIIIEDRAFAESYCLESVVITEGVTTIDFGAFEYCTKLQSIIIPSSVTYISNNAFSRCESLANITILGNGFNFSGDLFAHTAYYKDENNWENGVLYIGDYLVKAKQTVYGEYIIKQGTKAIADKAFSGCSNLTGVTIPDGVTKIGDSAFSGCYSISIMIIPDSVTSIGSSAFSGCYNLTGVKIPDSVMSIGASAFSGCSNLADIYYTGSVEKWKAIKWGGNNGYSSSTTIHYNYVPEN